MREIKFRAFYKYQNKIVDVLSIDFLNKRVYIEATKKGKPFGYINFDDCVLMQYTGLKDKNGIDIYGDDIVFHQSQPKVNYKIIWNNNGFMTEYKFMRKYENEEYEEKSYGIIHKSLEVIGNIYENADLLK